MIHKGKFNPEDNLHIFSNNTFAHFILKGMQNVTNTTCFWLFK